MNEEKSNNKNIQNKKWSSIPYEIDDLPAIGLFFKELYPGPGDYGNMGFSIGKLLPKSSTHNNEIDVL